ncbi:MAG: class I SAM-dependent methyltransferase [Hespellia sp.]|nr:class I SAM-dependent methyltransferase [Hespellia sp.]
MNYTIEYYNENSKEYYQDTFDVNFQKIQESFLNYIPEFSYILDFGCGSGRDTKYFLEQGFQVDAVDGSKKLCDIAEAMTSIKVKNMLFQELDEQEKYDGIWACASILHLPKLELVEVLKKIVRALKQDGIVYASFKYGEFEGEKDGRYFTCFTEKTFAQLLENIPELHIKEQWISEDVRENRGGEQWLNLILSR